MLPLEIELLLSFPKTATVCWVCEECEVLDSKDETSDCVHGELTGRNVLNGPLADLPVWLHLYQADGDPPQNCYFTQKEGMHLVLID